MYFKFLKTTQLIFLFNKNAKKLKPAIYSYPNKINKKKEKDIK